MVNSLNLWVYNRLTISFSCFIYHKTISSTPRTFKHFIIWFSSPLVSWASNLHYKNDQHWFEEDENKKRVNHKDMSTATHHFAKELRSKR